MAHGTSPAAAKLPTTLCEVYATAIRTYAKDDAFAYKHAGQWIKVSHAAFAERVRKIRSGFLALGVQRGDRVGLLSENRLEWTITDVALLSCGAVDVPIYATSTSAQIAYIINDSGATMLVLSNQKQFDKVAAAIGEMPELKFIITFDPVTVAAPLPPRVKVLTFEELEQLGDRSTAGDFLDEMARAAAPDDLATLIYTSGTTGDPKGVMLTHDNLTFNLVANVERLTDVGPDDVALSYLPLSHVYERTVMNVFIYCGVSVYFAESIDAVAQNLIEVQPTVMTSVPRIFEKILAKIEDEGRKAGGLKAKLLTWALKTGREYSRAKYQGSVPPMLLLQYDIAFALVLSKIKNKIAPRVKFFCSGGAALAEDVLHTFSGMGLTILQGYGLTETSPVITANTRQENRPGTVGKPLRGVEIKIAPDGEILTRGRHVMRGYYNKPDKTAEVLTPDGWFHTGDIGEIDADGFLRITDRKKDLFKTSGGKYIAPQPIENALTASPYIVQAVVVGNGRKFPGALIVPLASKVQELAREAGLTSTDYRELLKHPHILDFYRKEVERLTSHLAQWEKIKNIALLENELTIEGGELTPTLKVKRRVVDEKYKAEIDAIYSEKALAAAK
ncbi:MAG: long-chain fatty acid--CoA ligase [Chloracidobacterium sp.]|nr:long-chain fatty acid--CoA ligase [Chloracidobacterium sp.]MDW8217057.1 long-chain fatty acid--CoA ligase [Acidobacteriota bacterium]